MKTSLLCTTLLLAAVLFGCKKKTEATLDFGPLTAGSTWTYRSTTVGSPATSYTLTATNRDTIANGKTYRVISNSAGGNNYRNKTGSDYYSFGRFEALNANVEQLYLKDNADVNAKWQSTTNFTAPQLPIPLTATSEYTVREKGLSRTVNGVSFTNVIRVGLAINVSAGIGLVATGDAYYAPNVGLIESQYDVIANAIAQIPASTTTEILTSYSIK
jgi:hypothetical protein